jgi:putative alpha-1,2-mannosidase
VHRVQGDVTIEAPAADATHYYVRGVKVDGAASEKTWLPESFAQKGGKLLFELTQAPVKSWGTDANDAPPSFAPKGI